MRAVQEFDITAAVAAQWGCPVFSSPASPVSATIPFGLMERYGMVPMHWVQKRQLLHLGFCREVDYVAMAAVEKILECRAAPCFIPDSVHAQLLLRCAEAGKKEIAGFASNLGAEPIADIILDYVDQTGEQEIRMASTTDSVWARIGKAAMDLLF